MGKPLKIEFIGTVTGFHCFIENLEFILRNAIGEDEGLVVLHCDKDVPVEHLVNVAGIATSLEAKVSIASTPKK